MDLPVVEDVVLAGRYRLHSLLGTGGMAEVYDGWDERLARPVAVKLLRPELAAVADLRRRFELEARAAARLTHPNVVSVYDAGDDDGRSFIVMERLRGETLADSIRHGPVDGAWLRRLGGEVLSALGAAHEAGIVHRDIKPGNILLGPDGRAKVADFGIARVIESPALGEGAETAAGLTGAGLVVGTPAYLAPERAMGQPATPQSDLYSLGVVLYEALTGTKPYSGTTPAAIAAAAVQGVAQNPAALRPDADPEMVAVIGRAMALDPAHRYPSAAAMAADLHRSDPPLTAVMPAVPVPSAVGVTPVLPLMAAAAAAGLAAAGAAAAAAAMTAGGVAAPPAAGAAGPAVGLGAAAASAGGAVPPAAKPGFGGTNESPGVARSAGPRLRGRRALVMLGVAAIALVAVALVVTNAPPSSPASSSATTAAPGTTVAAGAPTPTAPGASEATTGSTVATVAGTARRDAVAAAIDAVAKQLARSHSAAAGQLATGLSNLATIADTTARAAAASNLLDQTIGWYQQGHLTTGEYATAAAILHIAGAPQAPPPTVAPRGNNSGGGGGGGE